MLDLGVGGGIPQYDSWLSLVFPGIYFLAGAMNSLASSRNGLAGVLTFRNYCPAIFFMPARFAGNVFGTQLMPFFICSRCCNEAGRC